MISPHPTALAFKAESRRRARDLRREIHARLEPEAGRSFVRIFLSNVPWRPEFAIAGYWPLPGEADARPLLVALHERGCAVALPVVEAKGAPLLFRRWRPGMVLEAGPHGTTHPPSDEPSLDPDLLLVPLLAFDRGGRRLGYGGGFYDRTLCALRARRQVVAVGIAYAEQELPALPDEPHDQRLDWIVTESMALETAR